MSNQVFNSEYNHLDNGVAAMNLGYNLTVTLTIINLGVTADIYHVIRYQI